MKSEAVLLMVEGEPRLAFILGESFSRSVIAVIEKPPKTSPPSDLPLTWPGPFPLDNLTMSGCSLCHPCRALRPDPHAPSLYGLLDGVDRAAMASAGGAKEGTLSIEREGPSSVAGNRLMTTAAPYALSRRGLEDHGGVPGCCADSHSRPPGNHITQPSSANPLQARLGSL